MSQEMMIANPQFNKNVFYRDIENIFYIPGIDKYKYKITADRPCKIEKSSFTDEFGIKYTCFKISNIPDVSKVWITLTGGGKNYGNFSFRVLPKAPKL
jgi:hypothetical protein